MSDCICLLREQHPTWCDACLEVGWVRQGMHNFVPSVFCCVAGIYICCEDRALYNGRVMYMVSAGRTPVVVL